MNWPVEMLLLFSSSALLTFLSSAFMLKYRYNTRRSVETFFVTSDLLTVFATGAGVGQTALTFRWTQLLNLV